MRVLGLDYGTKTVGVAVSDELMLTAQGIEVIRREKQSKLRPTIRRIKEIIEEYNIQIIILGYPKNMNNTIGDRAEQTKEFQKRLEETTGINVELWDERLSTVAADNLLIEGSFSRQERRKMIDKVAAVYILQGYLESRIMQNKQNENIL